MATAPTPEEIKLLNTLAREMPFEEFKRVVEQNLIALIGRKEAATRMTEYADDLPRYYEENWTAAAMAPLMINRF